MDVSIFREYDIRGIYPKTINEDAAKIIGEALGKIFSSGLLVLAHDARRGSESLEREIENAILRISPKISFLRIGLSSTPMFYYTVCTHQATGGIMITASHNPKEWNGMKIVGKMGKPITGKEIFSYINEEK